MHEPVSVVTLDMAGTTVSDQGIVEDAFAMAYAEIPELQVGANGTHRSEDEVRAYARETMGQSKISVFTQLTGNPDAAARATAEFERAYAETVLTGQVTPIEGAEEAIRALISEGYRVVFTTGFSRQTQDLILDTLGWADLAHDALVPADAGRGRPWPDLNLTALIRQQGTGVRHITVVGDTVSDMLSGARAGAGRVVGVLTGSADASDLVRAGATDVLESVAELPALLAAAQREGTHRSE